MSAVLLRLRHISMPIIPLSSFSLSNLIARMSLLREQRTNYTESFSVVVYKLVSQKSKNLFFSSSMPILSLIGLKPVEDERYFALSIFFSTFENKSNTSLPNHFASWSAVNLVLSPVQ